MPRGALVRGVLVAVTAIAASGAPGCAESTPPVETANVARPRVDAPAWPTEEAGWSPFHSVRFHLSIPLPHASSWVVDDRSRPELVATQASTRSTLVVLSEIEPTLVNHDRCDQRARVLGLVPDEKRTPQRTVEDVVTVGPEAYDTRVRVTIETPPPGAEGQPETPIKAHLVATGAYVRKCLFVHLATEVPSAGAEPVLSDRLALARVRLLGKIRLDELGDVKRESPELR